MLPAGVRHWPSASHTVSPSGNRLVTSSRRNICHSSSVTEPFGRASPGSRVVRTCGADPRAAFHDDRESLRPDRGLQAASGDDAGDENQRSRSNHQPSHEPSSSRQLSCARFVFPEQRGPASPMSAHHSIGSARRFPLLLPRASSAPRLERGLLGAVQRLPAPQALVARGPS